MSDRSARENAIEGYRLMMEEALKRDEVDLVTRELALNDLFFLLVYVLGVDFANNDWVFARCREVQEEPDGFLDIWSREHFKDLPLDTPILTQNRGWATHGELVPGDMVFSPSGSAVRVNAVTPIFTGNRCLKLTFQDGSEITCGEGHLWRVIDKKPGKRDKNGYRAQIRTPRIVEAKDLEINDNIGVLENPVEYPEAELPIHPYVLGAWLGDGSSSGPRITCAYVDIEIIYRMSMLLGYEVKEGKSPNRNTGLYYFGGGIRGKKGTGITPIMRRLGVLDNKHIPDLYKTASVEQRMELLRGLMDTDGSCNDRGTAHFCNINKRLIDDVYELATSLALRPHIRSHTMSVNGEPYTFYQVAFQAHTDRNPFHLARKAARAIKPSLHRYCRNIKKIEEVESVKTSCIQVDGGMYLAGRNLLPTHNSTVITFALTIKDILNDPTITVGIFSFNRPIAKAFMRQIKWQFESNQKLKDLFPDILYQEPEKESPMWSEDNGIVVKRSSDPKEATIEAWGVVDSQPTSKHFRLLVYDDVVTRDSVSSPDMINKTTDALSLSFNLGSNLGGKRRFIGTFYHYADTYSTLIARGAVKPRIYPATEDGTATGRPVLWSKETLAEKIASMGSYVSACQLLCKPVQEGEEIFSETWVRYWIPDMKVLRKLNIYILVDPASEKKESSDYTVMMVIGLGSDRNYYLIDMIHDRLDLRERTNRLFKLHAEYRPMAVGYEKYGMQSDISHMEGEMAHRNYRFRIIPLAGNTKKNDRIKRLQPIFQQGRFYLPEKLMRVDTKGVQHDLTAEFLQDEYRQFPFMSHDDMLDCMCRICDADLEAFFPQPSADDEPSWVARNDDSSYDYNTLDYMEAR